MIRNLEPEKERLVYETPRITEKYTLEANIQTDFAGPEMTPDQREM
ncbi:MAG: hypothetical protein ACP5FZ_04930 [Fidelibacterota bacterium]